MLNSKYLSLIGGIVILLLVGAYAATQRQMPGSPAPVVNSEWDTYADSLGTTFQYPKDFGTTYVEPVDWPPLVQFVDGPFSCVEAGDAEERAGRSERRVIDSRVYCVTEVIGAAAGSIYTQYAYATEKNGKVAILTFSTRKPQCANYESPQKEACEREQAQFSVDDITDRVMQTLRFEMSVSATINSFEECENAGFPIMESYPRQCRGPDGRTFVEQIESVGEFWGTIYGTVLLGPTCPVVQDPPDPKCADKPYQTRLAVTTKDGARVIKEFSSNAQGKFNIEIPPGTYMIRSAAAANVLPYCSSEVVTVGANGSVEAAVSCDTGIR